MDFHLKLWLLGSFHRVCFTLKSHGFGQFSFIGFILFKNKHFLLKSNHSLSLRMSVMAEAESKQASNPDLGINPSPPAIKSGFSFKMMAFGQFS